MIRRIACLTLVLYVFATGVEAADDAATVVASQGGVEVTLGDIDGFMQRMPEGDRAGYMNSPKRIESTIRNLLLTKQLAADARRNKLDKDPLIVKQIELATDDVLARASNAKFRADLKRPDFAAQAEEHYLTHKSDFVVKGQIDVEHVLISTTKHTKDDALKLAEQVEREARANPADFPKLVEKYSEDDSKLQNHGRIDDAGSDSYVPAFAEAARNLKKPGDVSPVVLTTFGYHVLKLIERKPDIQRPYEKVKKTIIEKMEREWFDAQQRGYSDELRNRPMDANPEAVASLRERYLPPGVKLPPEASEQPAEAADAPGN